eukprot:g9769.t1
MSVDPTVASECVDQMKMLKAVDSSLADLQLLVRVITDRILFWPLLTEAAFRGELSLGGEDISLDDFSPPDMVVPLAETSDTLLGGDAATASTSTTFGREDGDGFNLAQLVNAGVEASYTELEDVCVRIRILDKLPPTQQKKENQKQSSLSTAEKKFYLALRFFKQDAAAPDAQIATGRPQSGKNEIATRGLHITKRARGRPPPKAWLEETHTQIIAKLEAIQSSFRMSRNQQLRFYDRLFPLSHLNHKREVCIQTRNVVIGASALLNEKPTIDEIENRTSATQRGAGEVLGGGAAGAGGLLAPGAAAPAAARVHPTTVNPNARSRKAGGIDKRLQALMQASAMSAQQFAVDERTEIDYEKDGFATPEQQKQTLLWAKKEYPHVGLKHLRAVLAEYNFYLPKCVDILNQQQTRNELEDKKSIWNWMFGVNAAAVRGVDGLTPNELRAHQARMPKALLRLRQGQQAVADAEMAVALSKKWNHEEEEIAVLVNRPPPPPEEFRTPAGGGAESPDYANTSRIVANASNRKTWVKIHHERNYLECECCFGDDFLPEECVACEEHGHVFCKQCVKTFIDNLCGGQYGSEITQKYADAQRLLCFSCSGADPCESFISRESLLLLATPAGSVDDLVCVEVSEQDEREWYRGVDGTTETHVATSASNSIASNKHLQKLEKWWLKRSLLKAKKNAAKFQDSGNGTGNKYRGAPAAEGDPRQPGAQQAEGAGAAAAAGRGDINTQERGAMKTASTVWKTNVVSIMVMAVLSILKCAVLELRICVNVLKVSHRRSQKSFEAYYGSGAAAPPPAASGSPEAETSISTSNGRSTAAADEPLEQLDLCPYCGHQAFPPASFASMVKAELSSFAGLVNLFVIVVVFGFVELKAADLSYGPKSSFFFGFAPLYHPRTLTALSHVAELLSFSQPPLSDYRHVPVSLVAELCGYRWLTSFAMAIGYVAVFRRAGPVVLLLGFVAVARVWQAAGVFGAFAVWWKFCYDMLWLGIYVWAELQALDFHYQYIFPCYYAFIVRWLLPQEIAKKLHFYTAKLKHDVRNRVPLIYVNDDVLAPHGWLVGGFDRVPCRTGDTKYRVYSNAYYGAQLETCLTDFFSYFYALLQHGFGANYYVEQVLGEIVERILGFQDEVWHQRAARRNYALWKMVSQACSVETSAAPVNLRCTNERCGVLYCKGCKNAAHYFPNFNYNTADLDEVNFANQERGNNVDPNRARGQRWARRIIPSKYYELQSTFEAAHRSCAIANGSDESGAGAGKNSPLDKLKIPVGKQSPSYESFVEYVSEQMSQKKVRNCVECGLQFGKGDGCNHMKCPDCGAHMCYVCKQQLFGPNYYDHFCTHFLPDPDQICSCDKCPAYKDYDSTLVKEAGEVAIKAFLRKFPHFRKEHAERFGGLPGGAPGGGRDQPGRPASVLAMAGGLTGKSSIHRGMPPAGAKMLSKVRDTLTGGPHRNSDVYATRSPATDRELAERRASRQEAMTSDVSAFPLLHPGCNVGPPRNSAHQLATVAAKERLSDWATDPEFNDDDRDSFTQELAELMAKAEQDGGAAGEYPAAAGTGRGLASRTTGAAPASAGSGNVPLLGKQVNNNASAASAVHPDSRLTHNAHLHDHEHDDADEDDSSKPGNATPRTNTMIDALRQKAAETKGGSSSASPADNLRSTSTAGAQDGARPHRQSSFMAKANDIILGRFFASKNGNEDVKEEGGMKALVRDYERAMAGHHEHFAYVIHPLNPFLEVWNAFIGAAVIYITFMIVIYIGISQFRFPKTQYYFFYALDGLFILDMILHFRTGFIHDGHIVMDPKEIRKHYLHGWFWVDLLANTPWELIVYGFLTSKMRKQVKFLKWLKMPVLLRVTRLRRVLAGYFQNLNLVITLLAFFFVCHFAACIWLSNLGLCSDMSDLFEDWKYAEDVQDDEVISHPKLGLHCLQDMVFPMYWHAMSTVMGAMLGNLPNNEVEGGYVQGLFYHKGLEKRQSEKFAKLARYARKFPSRAHYEQAVFTTAARSPWNFLQNAAPLGRYNGTATDGNGDYIPIPAYNPETSPLAYTNKQWHADIFASAPSKDEPYQGNTYTTSGASSSQPEYVDGALPTDETEAERVAWRQRYGPLYATGVLQAVQANAFTTDGWLFFYCYFLKFLGLIMQAVLFAQVVEIVHSHSRDRKVFVCKQNQVLKEVELHGGRLSQCLQQRIKKYLKFRWVNKEYGDLQLLDDSFLSKSLKTEVAISLFHESLVALPFLENAPAPVLAAVCESFRVQMFMQGDAIYRRGEESDGFYILESGKVCICEHERIDDVLSPPIPGLFRQDIEGPGVAFGIHSACAFLTASQSSEALHSHSAFALTICKCLRLPIESLRHICWTFPRFFRRLREHRLKELEQHHRQSRQQDHTHLEDSSSTVLQPNQALLAAKGLIMVEKNVDDLHRKLDLLLREGHQLDPEEGVDKTRGLQRIPGACQMLAPNHRRWLKETFDRKLKARKSFKTLSKSLSRLSQKEKPPRSASGATTDSSAVVVDAAPPAPPPTKASKPKSYLVSETEEIMQELLKKDHIEGVAAALLGHDALAPKSGGGLMGSAGGPKSEHHVHFSAEEKDDHKNYPAPSASAGTNGVEKDKNGNIVSLSLPPMIENVGEIVDHDSAAGRSSEAGDADFVPGPGHVGARNRNRGGGGVAASQAKSVGAQEFMDLTRGSDSGIEVPAPDKDKGGASIEMTRV